MLTLPIKKKWYGMILSGEKTEEYREINHYYTARFRNMITFAPHSDEWTKEVLRKWPDGGKPFQGIVLRNGYRINSPAMMISGKIRVGTGRPEWGAEPGKDYYVLSIEKIEVLCSGEKWEDDNE